MKSIIGLSHVSFLQLCLPKYLLIKKKKKKNEHSKGEMKNVLTVLIIHIEKITSKG